MEAVLFMQVYLLFEHCRSISSRSFEQRGFKCWIVRTPLSINTLRLLCGTVYFLTLGLKSDVYARYQGRKSVCVCVCVKIKVLLQSQSRAGGAAPATQAMA